MISCESTQNLKTLKRTDVFVRSARFLPEYSASTYFVEVEFLIDMHRQVRGQQPCPFMRSQQTDIQINITCSRQASAGCIDGMNVEFNGIAIILVVGGHIRQFCETFCNEDAD